MFKTNLHMYPTPYRFESRMIKETNSLINFKLVSDIIILGLWEPGLKREESTGNRTTIYRKKLFFDKFGKNIVFKLLKFVEYFFLAIKLGSRKNIEIINCHSIHVLPAGVFLKLIYGKKLIYDAHEIETEVNGAKGFKKLFAKFVERLMIGKVDEVIVTSDGFESWYKNEYKHLPPITTIKNIPYTNNLTFNESVSLKKAFNIPESEILILNQGVMSESRGTLRLLNVFANLEKKKHIVFMGFGPLIDKVKEYSEKYDHIHYHPPVRPEELLSYTRTADVGIHPIQNTCLNHYYCLPNKLFEYIVAGLATIVSDVHDMRLVVEKYNTGWCISDDDQILISLLDSLNIDMISEKKRNSLKAKEFFGWQIEEKNYLDIFNRLSK